jgi:very-short-patch-repair endonuclease
VARRRDVIWPAHRLVVEVDSRGFHDTTEAFERDRIRDNELTLAGWTVLRFTYRRVVRDAAAVERDLVRAFATSGSRLHAAVPG